MLQPYVAEMVGDGAPFRELRSFINKVASRNTPVLLLGEPGTGKEMVSRSIHFASRRRNHPFISVDASLYYERELERELFGIEKLDYAESTQKGLLEFSSRGTCYISNAEELSPIIQERLFNYLDTGYLQRVGSDKPISSRVRLIFSSCKDLRSFSEGGLFSRDLFEQFSGLLFELEPLRSRPEDVPPFARQLADLYSIEHGGTGQELLFSEDALSALRSYPWPGNYDELKSELLRVFRSGASSVTPESLSPEITHYWLGRRSSPEIRKVIEEIENYIQEFRIMLRLDAEYGEILLDTEDWDLNLKCYDSERLP